jgi:hypothetical protein
MKTAFRHIRIFPCAERDAQEARGLFGFHDSPSCPNCGKVETGFTVHAGDSIMAPLVGYNPSKADSISRFPVCFTR